MNNMSFPLEGYSREELVVYYFNCGYGYQEIIASLSSLHQIQISLRHLNRILRKLGLYRRKHHIEPEEALIHVNEQLSGSASCFGYRLMHQKLRRKGVNIDRETVRLSIKVLDPEGVAERTNKRFKRRKYINKGPNSVWHLDGYDKLKPFGLAIHGAIDGYSRKILWLEIAETNNDPKVVASYFLNTLKELNLSPRCVRVDRGSENIIVGGIQNFFRGESNQVNEICFRYGPSTQNQRIESWWSMFRRNRCNWWINFFKDFCYESELLDLSIPFHVQLLRFCFIPILQLELDETKQLWNNHYIRKSKNSESPPGRPNVLYFTPHLSNGQECKSPLDNVNFDIAEGIARESKLFGCEEEIALFSFATMQEYNIEMPTTANEAKELLLRLIQCIGE